MLAALLTINAIAATVALPLLRRRRLRYRGSLVSRGGRGRGRLRGARTQAQHDSGCGKKDKYFHDLNSFVECSAQVSRTDVFLANFFSD